MPDAGDGLRSAHRRNARAIRRSQSRIPKILQNPRPNDDTCPLPSTKPVRHNYGHQVGKQSGSARANRNSFRRQSRGGNRNALNPAALNLRPPGNLAILIANTAG